MAKPQLEDGYTMIANEILERLAKIKLSPSNWRILFVILRKTYGFHKKVDRIANFQIIEATGLCKEAVSRSLGDLQQKNLIVRDGKKIGFQKDWQEWKLAESSTIKKLTVPSSELTKPSTKVSRPPVTQKKKETIQEKALQDANKLASQIREVFKGLKERNWDTPSRAKEAKAIKWMLAREYEPPTILMTYDRLKKEPFWSVRFLSMVKVAEQIGEFEKGAKGYATTAENKHRPKFDVEIIESGENESESRDIP